ncbi:MAG: PAS domain S-box protein, partial [Bacteroidales bacterium]|nr:PAS domain S-box protein [Bacteroidales bacterium]
MNDFSPFSTLPEPWKIWLSQPGVVAIITDTDGQILYISPSFEKIFSLSSKKYIGKRIQDFFHLPLSSWNIDKIGSTWLTNHAWLCIDNTWFWVYVEGIKPASFPWGNVILFLIHNLSPYLEEEAFFHFFKIFTERVEDAIFLMNRDIILACNESATSIFRTPTSQIIGRSVLDLSPPFQADGSSSKKLAYEYIQRALNGDIFSFTWIHSSADGSYTFPTRVNLSKIEFNNQSYLFTIVHDLKNENAWIEKIETQNELLQKINRYAVLFNLQPYEKILDTVVKFYEELFPGVLVIINKYDPIKKTFLIWHSNLALLHFKYFQRIINKKLEIYEVVLSEEDFQQIHAEKISPPITLEEATFHQIKPWQSKALSLLSGYRTFFSCVLISSDRLDWSLLLGFKKNMTLPNRRDLETAVNLVSSVIANFEAQKQIKEEHAHRQLILDNLPVFVGIYDLTDLIVVYANFATKEIFGYDPQEVIGKPIFSFVAPEDLPRAKGIVLSRLQGKHVGRYEARFVHKNGHLVWGSVDGVSIVYQGKRCILIIIMDVTQIRELQEKLLSIEVRRRKELEIELEKIKKELIHASRLAAIGQVSSFIAHELKNPLSAAGNALFLLEKKTHMLPELQKYIHIAR